MLGSTTRQNHPEAVKSVERKGPAKQSVAFNLLKRFRLHADAVLLFITDHAVPFTNNLGERAVRMPKVKQKISGCFRTVIGAENFCKRDIYPTATGRFPGF